jgi:transposase
MLTKMTEDDWAMVLEVLDAAQSERGEPGRDDRKFLEALHYLTVHSITWRALPAEFGNWNSIWKRFWRLSRTGVFEAFLQLLAETSKTAHVVQFFDSKHGGTRARLRRRCKGAGTSGTWPVRGGSSRKSASRQTLWPVHCLPSDRRRGQRYHAARDLVRHRTGYHAACRDHRQRLRFSGQPRGLPSPRHLFCYSVTGPSTFQDCLAKPVPESNHRQARARFMRVAMRCDKTQDSYGAFVAFACTLILVKSVHRAWFAVSARAGLWRCKRVALIAVPRAPAGWLCERRFNSLPAQLAKVRSPRRALYAA